MSFVDEEVIFPLFEQMMKEVFRDVAGVEIQTPFQRMSYQDAMRDYGVDKPDTRFEMKLIELDSVFEKSEFNVFVQTIKAGNRIKGLPVKNVGDQFSRKDLDEYAKFVSTYGAKGLLWYKFAQDGSISGPAAKFLTPDHIQALKNKGLAAGDLLFVVADQEAITNDSLGSLRLKVAERLNLIDKEKFNFLWVTGFPLLQYEATDGRWYACHHPFTSPIPEHFEKLLEGKDLGSIRAC
jgi:aspartyl-tRNA synthetase